MTSWEVKLDESSSFLQIYRNPLDLPPTKDAGQLTTRMIWMMGPMTFFGKRGSQQKSSFAAGLDPRNPGVRFVGDIFQRIHGTNGISTYMIIMKINLEVNLPIPWILLI